MKIVVTATGPQGSGKTTLLSDLTAFLQRYPMLTETEVRIYEGDGRTFSDNASTFTVAASPSGRKEAGNSGDRETYAMFKAEDGNWYVSRGNVNQAAFVYQDAARDFMRYESAPAARQAACDAILDGNNIVFDGARHYFTGGTVAKGGGGDSEKMSAAEAPAIHDLEALSLKDLCNQPLGEPYKPIAEFLGSITAEDINRYDSDKDLEEMMTTYSEQLADSVRSIIRDKTTGGHTKTKLRHVLNFLDKLTNSDVAIPCDFDDHERSHALHLADRLQEFVMANRASVTVNEGVKFDQTIEYLNRIAKGAGVILDEDVPEPDPVHLAARALYEAGTSDFPMEYNACMTRKQAALFARYNMMDVYYFSDALADFGDLPTGYPEEMAPEEMDLSVKIKTIRPQFMFAGLEWSEYETGDENTISDGNEPAAWDYYLAPDYGRYCAIVLGQIADALSIPREMLEGRK